MICAILIPESERSNAYENQNHVGPAAGRSAGGWTAAGGVLLPVSSVLRDGHGPGRAGVCLGLLAVSCLGVGVCRADLLGPGPGVESLRQHRCKGYGLHREKCPGPAHRQPPGLCRRGDIPGGNAHCGLSGCRQCTSDPPDHAAGDLLLPGSGDRAVCPGPGWWRMPPPCGRTTT